MVTKSDLHRLIDELPEAALPIAERFLTELEADENAPYTPPYEAPFEEPELDELQALAEGRPTIAQGGWISNDDLKRKLGLGAAASRGPILLNES